MRDRYGEGPLLLDLPGRRLAVLLGPDQVHRVLDESPEPFAVAWWRVVRRMLPVDAPLHAARPLPGTVSPFRLRFAVTPR